MAVQCSNTGVPLTYEARRGNAPSFAEPIPAALFDIAANARPTDGPGDAPLRLRVTDFEDSQVIAVSLNHALCDAVGIGRFMSAWSEAYHGGPGVRDVSFDRSAIPPMPFPPGTPPLSATEGVPEEYRRLHYLPEDYPEMPAGPLESPVFVTAVRDPPTIADLKQACARQWEDAEGRPLEGHLSTNDVLCAELIDCCGIPGEKFALSMIMEYRSLVGAETAFGNMWTGLEFVTKNSLAAAGDIRSALPGGMSKEWVEWHMGQGMALTWPGKLFMNSWTKALVLSEMSLAGPVQDVMLGLPMLQERATGMAPRGLSYCINLPQSNGGVKMVAIMAKAAGERLGAAQGGATMVPSS